MDHSTLLAIDSSILKILDFGHLIRWFPKRSSRKTLSLTDGEQDAITLFAVGNHIPELGLEKSSEIKESLFNFTG